MNSDFGFENRKAFIERARDEKLLNGNNTNINPGFHQSAAPKSRVARAINRYHKQARTDSNIQMNHMHKENFNRNFMK